MGNVMRILYGDDSKKCICYDEGQEDRLAEHYASSFPRPILFNDFWSRLVYHKALDEKNFNYGIVGLGVQNFFSYAAHFCKHEARNGAEIVSVGSGDGTVEREIIATYRKHFADEIEITLVDRNPDYKVDFRTVDDLRAERANVVGNCVVFIIWPEMADRNDGYDIEAISKLQPVAALVLYEPNHASGGQELAGYLRREFKEGVCGECGAVECEHDDFGLDNYVAEKVVSQGVCLNAGEKVEPPSGEDGPAFTTKPAQCVLNLRMVKLKRVRQRLTTMKYF